MNAPPACPLLRTLISGAQRPTAICGSTARIGWPDQYAHRHRRERRQNVLFNDPRCDQRFHTARICEAPRLRTDADQPRAPGRVGCAALCRCVLRQPEQRRRQRRLLGVVLPRGRARKRAPPLDRGAIEVDNLDAMPAIELGDLLVIGARGREPLHLRAEHSKSDFGDMKSLTLAQVGYSRLGLPRKSAAASG